MSSPGFLTQYGSRKPELYQNAPGLRQTNRMRICP